MRHLRSAALMLSLLLIFTIPWEGVVQLPSLGTLARSLGLAAGAFWLATVAVAGRIRKPAPFHIAVALFVLWNAVSVLWSADSGRSLNHSLTWVQLLVMVFMLWDLYTSRKAVMAGLQAYVIGAYVAIGAAMANYLAGNAIYTNYERFSSGETNPDGFGFIIVLGIPVAWYLASAAGRSRWERLMRSVNYAFVPIALAGIALSGTRTAMIAAVPAMAFGLFTLGRLRLKTGLVVAAALVSVVVIMLPRVQSLRSFQRYRTIAAELAEGDLNQRIGLWSEGLQSFAASPLVGVGSNTYRLVNDAGKVAHNSFISVLVELGLIGFALFGIAVASSGIQAMGQNRWDRAFWLTILGIWIIGSSTLTWEHRKSTWLFLGLLVVSAALTTRRLATAPTPQPQRRALPVERATAAVSASAGREEPLSTNWRSAGTTT